MHIKRTGWYEVYMSMKYITLLPIGYFIILLIAAPHFGVFAPWYFSLNALTFIPLGIYYMIRSLRLWSAIKIRHRKFDDSWLTYKKILFQLDPDQDHDLIVESRSVKRLGSHIQIFFLISILLMAAYIFILIRFIA